jgi:hypothetical protein
MLLYWSMLEWACTQGFRYFEFGRSTSGEGTFKFKEQWGAKSKILYWHNISLSSSKLIYSIKENLALELAARIWNRLPVSITKAIGPQIRKYISL